MNQQSAHQVNRTIHDADSHISEYDGWIEGYASEYVRANLDEPFFRVENIPQLKQINFIIHDLSLWKISIFH